jgi:hypothetical protein
MQYYAELANLVNDPFDITFQYPVYKHKGNSYQSIDIKYINPALSLQFASVGLEVAGAILFRKAVKGVGALHSDIVWDPETKTWFSCCVALNWNLNHTRSLMSWYHTEVPAIQSPQAMAPNSVQSFILSGMHYGRLGNSFVKNDPEYTLLDELDLSVPTLLRTDIPHMVENLDSQPRWCLSVRLKGNPNFDDCLLRLKQFS